MTRGDLGRLGGVTSGLFGVLLCGSSASTIRLVSADVEHLANRFPLVRCGVPNLNSQKFRDLRVPSARCSASEQVIGMLAMLARRDTLPPEALPAARLVSVPTQRSTAHAGLSHTASASTNATVRQSEGSSLATPALMSASLSHKAAPDGARSSKSRASAADVTTNGVRGSTPRVAARRAR